MGKNTAGNGKHLQEYLKYSSFNVMGMLGFSLYILADTYFIAKGMGARGLTALNLAIPIYSLIHGTGLMMGMGGATKYSAYKAQLDDHKALKVFTTTLVTGAAFAAVYIFAGIFFAEDIAVLIGANESVYEMTRTYLNVLLVCALFFITNDILVCFVRNDNDPRLSMIAMVGGSFGNIILDYIFIFPLDMGIFGAVLATCMAPVISMMILSIHWIKGKSSLRPVKMKPEPKTAGNVLSLGIPSLITEVSAGIVILVFNFIILDLHGNIGVAAYGVIANISYVVICIYTGIAQGIQPIMSRDYGAEDFANVKRVLKYAVVTVAAVSFVIYAVVFFFATPITDIFNSEGNVQLREIAVGGIKLYFTELFLRE